MSYRMSSRIRGKFHNCVLSYFSAFSFTLPCVESVSFFSVAHYFIFIGFISSENIARKWNVLNSCAGIWEVLIVFANEMVPF